MAEEEQDQDQPSVSEPGTIPQAIGELEGIARGDEFDFGPPRVGPLGGFTPPERAKGVIAQVPVQGETQLVRLPSGAEVETRLRVARPTILQIIEQGSMATPTIERVEIAAAPVRSLTDVWIGWSARDHLFLPAPGEYVVTLTTRAGSGVAVDDFLTFAVIDASAPDFARWYELSRKRSYRIYNRDDSITGGGVDDSILVPSVGDQLYSAFRIQFYNADATDLILVSFGSVVVGGNGLVIPPQTSVIIDDPPFTSIWAEKPSAGATTLYTNIWQAVRGS